MTDKLIGCVQHDCERCKSRDAYAQVCQTEADDLRAEVERLTAAMNPDWDVKSAALESVREHMEIANGLQAEVERLKARIVESGVELQALASGAAQKETDRG